MDHAKADEFVAAEKLSINEREFEHDEGREIIQPAPVDAETLRKRQRVTYDKPPQLS